ncbi:MAG: substrate-binding domain-containing protein [Acidimicrobiia bacterium]
MTRNFRRPRGLVAAIGALVMTFGVGGGIAAAQGTGEIIVEGSSTVGPITSLVAELYGEENPDVAITVGELGTGDGFVQFCEGETDISDASRPIKDEGEEGPACDANSIEYTELPVGVDGLTVIVNKKSNLGLKCLSQADLYALFGPESTGDLADASALAGELGSTQTFKSSGTFKKFTPGPESGTYDAFIELGYQDFLDERVADGSVTDVIEEDGETLAAEPLISDGQFPNDNDIVKRVAASESGVGFLGVAYFLANTDKLKAVAIEDPDSGNCVKPSIKTVQNGTYLPLSRTLYIYVNNAKAAENADVKDFVDFYLTKTNLTKTVKDAGYAPLSADDIQASIDAWASASG